MNPTNLALRIALGAGLALTLACGGSSSSTPAAAPVTPAAPALHLYYTNATAGTVTLVKDAALSSGSHLVLDVVGNDATIYSAGLMMTLSVEPTVAQWAKVQASDTDLVENGALYDLGTTTPVILKAKSAGGTLTFALGEKGYLNAKPTTGVLAKIALDIQASASSGAVIFTAPAAGNQFLVYTDTGGALAPFTPGVGALEVK